MGRKIFLTARSNGIQVPDMRPVQRVSLSERVAATCAKASGGDNGAILTRACRGQGPGEEKQKAES